MNLKLFFSVFLLLLFKLLNCASEIKTDLENCHVQCSEKEEFSDTKPDPILIKICTYKNFQSVRTGTADYKGRYSYEYQLYRVEKNVKQKIKNSQLFKSGADKVEKKLNQDLQQKYQQDVTKPHLRDCMERITFRHYELDEIGMAFSDNNQLEFFVDYKIGGACLNVAHSILKYPLSDFKQYLE